MSKAGDVALIKQSDLYNKYPTPTYTTSLHRSIHGERDVAVKKANN